MYLDHEGNRKCDISPSWGQVFSLISKKKSPKIASVDEWFYNFPLCLFWTFYCTQKGNHWREYILKVLSSRFQVFNLIPEQTIAQKCKKSQKIDYPLHRYEFGLPKFFSKTFKFAMIFYSTWQISGAGQWRNACRSREKESKQSEITWKHSEPVKSISKIEKRREFVRALWYEQCPKYSFKRLYTLKKLLVLVEKASISTEFRSEFHRVTISWARLQNAVLFSCGDDFNTCMAREPTQVVFVLFCRLCANCWLPITNTATFALIIVFFHPCIWGFDYRSLHQWRCVTNPMMTCVFHLVVKRVGFTLCARVVSWWSQFQNIS